MKTCSKCGIEKEDTDYYNHASRCKLCAAVYAKQYAAKNKSAIKVASKLYYNDNKEKCKAAYKIWHDSNKDRVREHQYKNTRKISSRFKKAKRAAIKRNKKWELTLEEFQKLIEMPFL